MQKTIATSRADRLKKLFPKPMTRKTIGLARYGLIFDDGETTVLYAVALIQALGACSKRPIRVFVFERESAIVLDETTLAKCWEKSLRNY